jgi:ribosome biogenesis GTPase
VGEQGQQHHEPRLQAKRYRRPSRRSQKQTLDEWRYGLDDPVEELDLAEDGEADFTAG